MAPGLIRQPATADAAADVPAYPSARVLDEEEWVRPGGGHCLQQRVQVRVGDVSVELDRGHPGGRRCQDGACEGRREQGVAVRLESALGFGHHLELMVAGREGKHQGSQPVVNDGGGAQCGVVLGDGRAPHLGEGIEGGDRRPLLVHPQVLVDKAGEEALRRPPAERFERAPAGTTTPAAQARTSEELGSSVAP